MNLTPLQKLARGQDCQVRVPGICNFNCETTVLAHYRLSGQSGIGFKSPDLLAAWCCSDCHDAIDGRITTEGGRERVRLYHLEGVLRTIAEIDKRGLWPYKKSRL